MRRGEKESGGEVEGGGGRWGGRKKGDLLVGAFVDEVGILEDSNQI